MKILMRFCCLISGCCFLLGCQDPGGIEEADLLLPPAVLSYEWDTITRPDLADSTHLWIVPNHMLWIPLEFEEAHLDDAHREVL